MTDVSDGPVITRETIVGAVETLLAGHDATTLAAVRAALSRELENAGAGALAALARRLTTDGGEWAYYPPDPLARRIHHVLADLILGPGSDAFGLEHVAAVSADPVVIFSNHLSYSDANCLEVLLHRRQSPLADRLTAIAGPKVYSSLKRRFSSLCFGTVKTPQSAGVSSDDAVMNPREVARAARRSIEAAHERLRAGDALLLFAEGTRSRDRGLQTMLAGAMRYLDDANTWVLPVGITGTDALFPVGGETLHSVQTIARFGRPVRAGALRDASRDDRRVSMDAIGLAIAAQLPPGFRGTYGDGTGNLADARRVSRLFEG